MHRIMVVGSGLSAALIAVLASEAVTLGTRPGGVVIVDDSVPPSAGTETTPAVIGSLDADVYIIGAGSRHTFGGHRAAQALAQSIEMYCPETYALPSEHYERPPRQKGRYPMDRKQQSMQAKLKQAKSRGC